jgi:hypothetical protein
MMILSIELNQKGQNCLLTVNDFPFFFLINNKILFKKKKKRKTPINTQEQPNQPTKRNSTNPQRPKSLKPETHMEHSTLHHVSLAFPTPRRRACIAVVNGAFQISHDFYYLVKAPDSYLRLSPAFRTLQTRKKKWLYKVQE